MMNIRSKLKIILILIPCVMLLVACSKTNKNTQEQSTPNEQLATNERDIEERNLITNAKHIIEKMEIPESIFTISNINGAKSLFFISDINGGSEINREVIEVLTEFAAEDVDEGTKLTLPETILFDYDSAELRSEANEAIEKLVTLSEELAEDITIIGHTDSRGESDYNQKLSEERSKAVLKALIDSGVEEKRLTAKGKGDTEPVAKNEKSDGTDNPEGREKNRRVEIIIHGFNH